MMARTKIRLGLLLVLMFAAGLGTVSAQVDPQFVISGEIAAQIGEMNTINGATAKAISHACERIAAERGENMAIMILDNFGNKVHVHRMDGPTFNSINFAERKARTAMLTRAPTHLLQNIAADDPLGEPREVAMGLFPTSGGLPIWVGDQIIGFIGVGGSRPRPPEWSDEICAHLALEEIVGPQPPLTANPD